MKRIFFIIYIIVINVLIVSCERSINAEKHYINVDCKIVSIGQVPELSDDKFHKPLLVKSVLIQLVDDTTEYCELTNVDDRLIYSNNDKYSTFLTTEWFYNHKVGDIIHFDYIGKDRFFHIKNRE